MDRPFDGPRRMSLGGLVAVMAFLGGRLVSQLGVVLNHAFVSFAVKAICWALVTGGALWGVREKDKDATLPQTREAAET
jgi:fucose permease